MNSFRKNRKEDKNETKKIEIDSTTPNEGHVEKEAIQNFIEEKIE